MNDPTVKACPICGMDALQNCWHERPGLDSIVRTVEMPVSKALALAKAGQLARQKALIEWNEQIQKYEAMIAKSTAEDCLNRLAELYRSSGDVDSLVLLNAVCRQNRLPEYPLKDRP